MTSLVLSGRLRVPPVLKDDLARPRLDALLDPGNYTGLAAEFVDRVLARDPTGSH